ncbi:MAG: hypothetical protein ACE5IR_24155 [bacterium]
MELREETLSIFKQSFGTDNAYKVLEFIESRVRDDVATQKDIYELKFEIEKIRADLQISIAKVRTDLLKWSFAFWFSQVALLTGILFKLLS